MPATEMRNINRRHAMLLLGGIAGVTTLFDAAVSLRNRIVPRGIVIHHSALPNDEGIGDIEKLHTSRGFGIFYWYRIYHIGYHYVIQASGHIVPIRPEHLRGSHARGANDMLGICILGNFDSSGGHSIPTADQMRALQTLCASLLVKHRLSTSDIYRHKDLDSYTACPGHHFPFDQLLNSLQSQHH